jgi:hypothetical protein
MWLCGANVGNEWTGNATTAGLDSNNATAAASINSNRGLAGNLTVDSGAQ